MVRQVPIVFPTGKLNPDVVLHHPSPASPPKNSLHPPFFPLPKIQKSLLNSLQREQHAKIQVSTVFRISMLRPDIPLHRHSATTGLKNIPHSPFNCLSKNPKSLLNFFRRKPHSNNPRSSPISRGTTPLYHKFRLHHEQVSLPSTRNLPSISPLSHSRPPSPPSRTDLSSQQNVSPPSSLPVLLRVKRVLNPQVTFKSRSSRITQGTSFLFPQKRFTCLISSRRHRNLLPCRTRSGSVRGVLWISEEMGWKFGRQSV